VVGCRQVASVEPASTPIDKTAIASGILAAVMGLFIVLSAIGIIPSRMAAGVERWIGVVAEMAFVCGGFAVVIQTCVRVTPERGSELTPGTPFWVRTTLHLLSLAIVVSLATIGTLVAFGTGERKFSSTIPFLPVWLNEPLGRTVFGFGAMLTWFILIVMMVMGFRSLRRPKQ
jgi:hypothetical protein